MKHQFPLDSYNNVLKTKPIGEHRMALSNEWTLKYKNIINIDKFEDSFEKTND